MEHLCQAVEASLSTSNWYAALMVALTLPDIAARIDDPTIASSTRYKKWIEAHLMPRYTRAVGAQGHQHIFLTGGDCYALRCAFLHEGGDDVSQHSAAQALVRFQFLAPRPALSMHCNQVAKKLQLQVDIFCNDIVSAIRAWASSIPSTDTSRLERLQGLATIQTDGPVVVYARSSGSWRRGRSTQWGRGLSGTA